jgi:mRNA interferase RelE/StbE
MFRVELRRSAQKELADLDKPFRLRALAILVGLETEPRPVGCLKMSGLEDTYRIRMGTFRIVYTIQDQLLLVQVVRIANRRDVYR